MKKLKKESLKSWQYLHCSMGGSLWVPCKVLNRAGDKVDIRYYDFLMDEDIEITTESERLRFE